MPMLQKVALTLALMAPLACAAPTPAVATDYVVVIEKMKFGPTPDNLQVGDVIVWQNKDILRHTATARDKSFDVDLPPGAEAKTTMGQAGSFAFFCRFHPGMTGTLNVSP